MSRRKAWPVASMPKAFHSANQPSAVPKWCLMWWPCLLIQYAQACGKHVITGADVFAIQAVEQFVLYTGMRPDNALFIQATKFARG